MVAEELSLTELIYRAYSRALSPTKTNKLIASWLSKRSISEGEEQANLSSAFLDNLAFPETSPLLLSYLSIALTSILQPESFITLLLFRLQNFTTPHLLQTLSSISSILLQTPWGQNISSPIPSFVTDSLPPDVGTSTSTSSNPVSTLSLMIPLLRLCVLPTPPSSMPILGLTVRLISSIQPYPAPSLDIGIEASGYLPQLPDMLSQKLRDCLSGLMADLTMSQNIANMNIANNAANANMLNSGDIPILATTFPKSFSTTTVSLPHIISYLLAYAKQQSRYHWETPDFATGSDQLSSGYKDIVKIGRFLTSPELWMLNLIEGSLMIITGTHQSITPDFVNAWIFNTEILPSLLKYWKENSNEDWPYPNTLPDCLNTALDVSAPNLTSLWGWQQALYATKLAEAETDDESGPFSPIEGWISAPVQEVLINRLVGLDLLDSAAGSGLLGAKEITRYVEGESLLDRLLGSSPTGAATKLYEDLISTAPGAQKAFARQVIDIVKNCPSTPPPENMLTLLSARPNLLIALTSFLSPHQLLELAMDNLINADIDESAWNDDPQGVLTRFGEGVVFVEAMTTTFDLKTPPIFQRSKRAVDFRDMTSSEQSNLNGWVKALFGSDGIDDQNILSTTPHEFSWLATSVIYQAIQATIAGQLDLDALHSGLSYFSQALLSWSSGGIIFWLCDEIQRNGLISGLHLDVLQNLVLDDSCPTAILQITGRRILRIFNPSNGLEPVFQSSKFEVQAVRAKIEPLISTQDPSPTSSFSNSSPAQILRSQLPIIRHFNMAQPSLAGSFLIDFKDCLLSCGSRMTISTIIEELLYPSMEYDRSIPDPLGYLAAILFVLPMGNNELSAIEALLGVIPRLILDEKRVLGQNGVIQICQLIKNVILLYLELNGKEDGNRLVLDVLGELERLKARVSSGNGRDLKRAKKSKSQGRSGMTLSENLQQGVSLTLKVLSNDEELRTVSTRWSQLAEDL